MRFHRLLVPFLALLSVPAVSGPSSAQYPPTAGTLNVSSTQLQAAGSVSVSGGGCAPNATVSLTLQPPGTSVGSTQADASGNFSATVTIPATTDPGSYNLVATCVSSTGATRTNTAAVAVLATTIESGGGPLPRTGSSSSIPLGVAGVALVAAGSLAVLAARRKRTTTAGTAG